MNKKQITGLIHQVMNVNRKENTVYTNSFSPPIKNKYPVFRGGGCNFQWDLNEFEKHFKIKLNDGKQSIVLFDGNLFDYWEY